MDISNAIQIVQAWLDKLNADPLAPDKLVIDTKLTVERNMFWGIYYRVEGDDKESPGLAIVDKMTRRLYNTVGSSWYNWIKEFETYKETGYSEIDWGRSEVIEREVKRMSLPQMTCAVISGSVKHEERENKLKELLHAVITEVQRQGLKITGNPVSQQRNKNEFGADMEVRISVDGTVKEGSVTCCVQEAFNIYCIEYTGNYYDFVGALHELKRYGRVNGLKEKGEPWIEYLEYDLQRSSDTWKNRVCIPVE